MRGRDTWLTPYDQLWQLVAMQQMNFKLVARALQQVEREVGPETCLRRFGRYLELIPLHSLHPLYTVLYFAKHHADYDPPEQLTLLGH